LYELLDEHFIEFPHTKTAVVAGDASEEILNYIEAQRIDLVIMATHGRKGMDKIIFGSVAERVVKNSPVPVMVVNPYKMEGKKSAIKIHTVHSSFFGKYFCNLMNASAKLS